MTVSATRIPSEFFCSFAIMERRSYSDDCPLSPPSHQSSRQLRNVPAEDDTIHG